MCAQEATSRALESTATLPSESNAQTVALPARPGNIFMSEKILTNREAIELHLKTLLDGEGRSKRWFAAKTLGDIGRTEKGDLRRRVLEALQDVARNDEDLELRSIAEHSIREINGEFDRTSEKYNPQEPLGSLREQYYLKRG